MPTEAFRTNKRISRRKYAINHFPLHWVYASMKYLSKKKNLVSDGGEFNRLLCLHRPPEKRLEFKKFNYPVSIGASVVVPVYNVEQYLNECLSALLCDNASENQYEVIAVNDGSSDGSGQILEQWAKQTRKLKVINQPNGGLSAARNTGLNEAKGEYVAFVDSDDVMNIESILDLIAALKKSHADYASGLYQRVDDVGRILSPVDYISSTMVPWGRVYKRSLWDDVRFPVGYWYEDIVMPYLIESRYKGIDVEVTPYLYRKRPGSIVESTSVDVRGLDSFWLISYMLDECTRAGMPVNQCIYDTTIRLMGPLLVGRTLALKPDERRDLFIACCNLIQRQKEFSRLRLKGSEYWVDVETALKTYNYRLWATGIFGVAMCEGGLGLKSAVSLVKESLRCPIS